MTRPPSDYSACNIIISGCRRRGKEKKNSCSNSRAQATARRDRPTWQQYVSWVARITDTTLIIIYSGRVSYDRFLFSGCFEELLPGEFVAMNAIRWTTSKQPIGKASFSSASAIVDPVRFFPKFSGALVIFERLYRYGTLPINNLRTNNMKLKPKFIQINYGFGFNCSVPSTFNPWLLQPGTRSKLRS